MQATLHLPGAAPRLLTGSELATLGIHAGAGGPALDFVAAAPALRALLGTAIPVETFAGGPGYLILVPENAADYDFGLTPSASADVERLTGVAIDEEDPLTGPLLIIEA
ncbi:hypothetical protein [Hymenobacter convexus]|uniref:hypothetical protein n=1 Tax=Hymenobacter sp. CA1UV-4 TaxID=3063782 RepID=UPI002713D488|nr:hypothetical protein [Hymenobacter sp. CA1UV-4]MDO7853181.1 hypothetical protein [Hymenobacter sp. CA1UV-4]